MSGVLRRYFLRRKERKSLLQEVSETLEIDAEEVLGSKPQIEVIETARHSIFVVNGLPILAKSGEDFFPTLFFRDCFALLPKIAVNMGAVPHVCNGADVMAPGIVEVQGDFKAKDLVLVLDERNRRPIAIARSIVDSDAARILKRGRVFENLHHVGDGVWEVIRSGKP